MPFQAVALSPKGVVKGITLYFTEGTSDKVYEAAIVKHDGMFLVKFAYGRRYKAMKEGQKTDYTLSLHEATEIYDDLIFSKTAKGYTEDKSGVPFTFETI